MTSHWSLLNFVYFFHKIEESTDIETKLKDKIEYNGNIV